jgi:hypothetical protein
VQELAATTTVKNRETGAYNTDDDDAVVSTETHTSMNGT